jgi:hypothetical protein
MTTQHTPVYIKYGYGWLDNAWVDKTMDAELIGNTLERYQDKSGKIDGDVVIDDAENDPSHPLHEYLTKESLEEAVRQRRREQLRQIFRSLAIVWRNPQTGDIIKDNERAYAALGTGNREQTGKFQILEVKRLPAPKTEQTTHRTYEVATVKKSKPEPTTTTAQPEPQPEPAALPSEPQSAPEPQSQPLRVAAPPPAAMNELPEQHKRALGILKRWAESYRDNAYFAPIVAVVDSYPDPD